MTVQDLGSIGELVGAIATVATLAYLAVQVSQNTSHMKESSRLAKLDANDRTVAAFSRYRAFLMIPENADLYLRGRESYKSLSNEDKVRFRAMMEECFFATAAMIEREQSGLYDHSALDWQIDGLARLVQQPGVSEWWHNWKHMFGQELVATIESRSITGA